MTQCHEVTNGTCVSEEKCFFDNVCINGSTPIHDQVKTEGAAIVDDRMRVYGEPKENWTRIAMVWSGILGIEVSAIQATLCMAGLKLVRSAYTPDYSDNLNDVEGYVNMTKTIVGDDMIDAQSTAEYLEKYAERRRGNS